MYRERFRASVGPCPGGHPVGQVIEVTSENDHAYMRHLDPTFDGYELDCAECARDLTVYIGTVANPIEAPAGMTTVYFVRRDELARVRALDGPIREKLAAADEAVLGCLDAVEALRDALVLHLESQARRAKGVTGKFRAIGAALGFADIDSFRARVGRKQPGSYVHGILQARDLREVLVRLGHEPWIRYLDALHLARRQAVAEKQRLEDELRSTALSPVALHVFVRAYDPR